MFYIKNDQPINNSEVISGTTDVLTYILAFSCPEMKNYENQIKLYGLKCLLKEQEKNDYLELPDEVFKWAKKMLKASNFEQIFAGKLLKSFEDGLTEKPNEN